MLLTDTLPFELPLYFSNERLASSLLAGGKSHPLVRAALSSKSDTVPFLIDVGKAKSKFRRVALLHPAAQCRWVGFYARYDSYISQLCVRSPFSLRAPSRPASRYFDSRFADHGADLGEGPDVDTAGFRKQSTVASSYFAYKRYAHFYKFFNSTEFERLEMSYGLMLQLDISKCFQSIYTHSITWAVRGKQFAKDNRRATYFEDEFDRLMRSSNWGETNGIVIGPEVSRIFAEIILQSVDVRLAKFIGEDVAVRRYVDDYIFFANSETDLTAAEEVLREELQKFNLYLNDSKRNMSQRPLVTPLTVARAEVLSEVEEFMLAVRNCVRVRSANSSREADSSKSTLSSSVITRVRHSARRYSVSYGELSASSLAVVARHLNLIGERSSSDASPEYEMDAQLFQTLLVEVIRLAEFFFLMDIRSATSNKMARIFLEVSNIAKHAKLGEDLLQMQILDVTRRSLNLRKKVFLADILNVVIAADIVCQGRQKLSISDILRLLDRKNPEELVHIDDYLTLSAALYFARDRHDMRALSNCAKQGMISKLSNLNTRTLSRAADCIMLFDFLGCPYVDESERVALYREISPRLLGGKEPPLEQATGSVRRIAKELGFVSWIPDRESLDRLRALLAKKELRPAYE